MIGIYVLTNTITGEQYVGQSIHIEKRIKEHFSEINRLNTQLAWALKQYGIENFIWNVLEECPLSMLNEREKYWIARLNTFNNGYNMTDGGTDRCYIANRVNSNKDVLELYSQGYSIKEIKNKLNQGSWFGIKNQLLESGIDEQDIITRGNQRRCRSNVKVVSQYDLNGNYIQTYPSLNEAERQTNISRPNISNVCLGNRKSAGGYIWKFGEKRK